MSYIKAKSNFNIDSAEILIKESMYAPSVHCSYYGCFQFLKYTLKNYKDYSYEEIESDSMSSGLGTHVYVIKCCLEEYRKKGNESDYKDLKRNIKDLKEFRISSDYYNTEILIDEGEKSLSLSKTIISEIKKILR